MLTKYCNSLFNYERLSTRSIVFGDVVVGGGGAIVLQSMTNTATDDIDGTVAQCIRIFEAGGATVRITVPTMRDVEYLALVRDELRRRGYSFPLIADVHFSAKVAVAVARVADKVRINPGNFVDRQKSFKSIDYTDAEYEDELGRIRDNLLPYIEVCKEFGTATRIGTNHGSLSDRIMSRYGDTPRGMAESTMEFLRICRDADYSAVVVSLKASNTVVLVCATRLLVSMMLAEGMYYPLHIGVTEAGDSVDGRIKSAVGIGALLGDGIGDTVRVSLTEEPEYEIPVAAQIVDAFGDMARQSFIAEVNNGFDGFVFSRRVSRCVGDFGGGRVPLVIARSDSSFSTFCYHVELIPDYYYCGDTVNIPVSPARVIIRAKDFLIYNNSFRNYFPCFELSELQTISIRGDVNFVKVRLEDLTSESIEILKREKNVVILAQTDNLNFVGGIRALIFSLDNAGIDFPIVVHYVCDFTKSNLGVSVATRVGCLFIDGLADGIFIDTMSVDVDSVTEVSFSILQACRLRMSKTEYISCPGCGRTLYDLQSTTQRIKDRTSHLKNLKIGIMGCIVNGPGEMADADYGYVGAGPGLISLYKGKETVKKNIPEAIAVDELIALIKANGDWFERV